MRAVEFWDRQHQRSDPAAPPKGDPILEAALTYFGDVTGKRLLDVGCGLGAASVFFASRGAHVVSIDLSAVAISKLRAYCLANGLLNVTPLCLPAADITSLGHFDFVIGSMILHHIEPFQEFTVSLRQVLSPTGKAFFYENSAASSFLIWFRNHVVGRLGVPKFGDSEEFPLTPDEIRILSRLFSVRIVYPELLFFRLASTYLLRGHWGMPFAWLDTACFRIPWMRRNSYRQFLQLEPL
jgi:2-polyprenyl-3-methyl-5-hydroxy-6-metoxy-1,4-benzoquinol methylase